MNQKIKAASSSARLSAYWRQNLDYKNLKDKNDITLNPYISPLSTLSSSNWAKDFLHISDYAKKQYSLKKKIVVFILDTAAVITHKDLRESVDNLRGKNFTSDPAQDGNGHSTACASCYVSPVNGCAPANMITIVPIKVLKDNGSGSYSSVLKGINYAYDAWRSYYPDYAAIISMSLGGGGSYKPIEDAIIQVSKAGMFVFASAGNSGYSDTVNKVGFPAKAAEAIAVGSVDKSGKVSSFSSAGPEVDYTGPGSAVMVAWKDDTYIVANGTSFSMPYTAAAFCWLISVHDLLGMYNYGGLGFFNRHITDLNAKGWDRATGLGTPMLNAFIGKTPDFKDDPEPAPEPEPEPEPTPDPVREERDLVFTFSGNYMITWKNQKEANKHRLSILEVNVAINTVASAENAHDKLKKAVEWFFKNRGLILSVSRNNMTANDLSRAFIFSEKVKRKTPYLEIFTSTDKDFADAAYWTKRFFEVVLKTQKGLNVKVMQITYMDEKQRQTIIL